MTSDLAAYVGLTFFLVITPGATTAVVVRNAIAGGVAGGVRAALGAATANATQASIAGLGLSTLIRRSPVLEDGIRIGGALYLTWLGLASLRASWRNRGSSGGRAEHGEPDRRAAFREGLVVNLLNPPITTFYLAVVPAFMPAGASARYYVLLAGIHVLMAFACHATWALGLDRLRGWLHEPWVPRTLAALTGGSLLVLAWQVYRG